MKQNRYAIIVAGGTGTRMGSVSPKQFLNLNGLPILMRTINAFASSTVKPIITLVLPADQIEAWNMLCKEYSFKVPHSIVSGGDTRFQSVKNGLMTLEGEGLVAIHDGVRPLVSHSLIERCFRFAESQGNAIPAIKPVESVRIGNAHQNRKENRDLMWLAQTPQVFNLIELKECYNVKWSDDFTDDASVAEAFGISINIVEGERENIKITSPLDLAIAETILGLRLKGK